MYTDIPPYLHEAMTVVIGALAVTRGFDVFYRLLEHLGSFSRIVITASIVDFISLSAMLITYHTGHWLL